MLIKQSNTSTFEQLEDGLFPATCVQIIGVGTQPTPFKNEDGTDKVQNRVIFTFETKGGNLISKEYTASLHEKANLRKDLESWRGKKFTEEELDSGFDIKDVLGKVCTVQVMRNKNDYATVTAVLPKTEEHETDRSPVYYYVGEHEPDVFDSLPEWIQRRIENSFEWKKEHKSGYEKARAKADEIKAKQEPEEINIDDPIDLSQIPF